MKKPCILIFLCFNFLVSAVCFAQCTDCYSINQAMEKPGLVRELHLSNQGLKEIPSEISKMPNLIYLDLSFNEIACVDSQLDNLLSLEYLNLSNNFGFTLFCFSNEFFENTRIKNLQLESCEIGNLDYRLSKIEELQTLNLANNRISYLPLTYSSLKNLKNLNLANNDIKDFDTYFAKAWNLETLDITNNNDLNYEKFCDNLHYKSNLHNLKFSPELITKEMALGINNSGIKILTFVDCDLAGLSTTLRQNVILQKVEFVNCEMEKPIYVYRVLKDIKNLDEVSYVHTPVYEENKLLNASAISMTDVDRVETDALNARAFATINSDKNSLTQVDMSSKKLQNVIKIENIEVSEAMMNNALPVVIEIPLQTKKIDSEKENTVCFENTMFEIPKNTFVNADGSTYAGPVTIEVIEYFDPISNALSGMPMMAESNTGREIFTSNGMFSFNAKDENNKDLAINPLSEIVVELNDLQPSMNSQLYQLDSTNNWQVIGVPTRKSVNMDSLRLIVLDSLNKISDKEFIQIDRKAPKYAIQITKKSRDPYEIQLLAVAPKFKRAKIQVTDVGISYYNKESHSRWLSKQKWYLDTLINPNLKDSLKLLAKEQRYYIKNYLSFNTSTNLIEDVTLKTDFVNDNFIMSFNYKGQLKEMPVYFKSKKQTIKELKKQSDYYKKYLKDEKFSVILEDKVGIKIDSMSAEVAAAQRIYLSNILAQQRAREIEFGPVITAVRTNTLRFGFSAPGRYNCDYFYNNVPDELLVLSDSISNSDGEKLPQTNDVRFILTDANVSFAVAPNRIPYYNSQKAIIILVYEDNRIGIIKNYERSKVDLSFIVHELNIKGMSSEDVRKAINNI